MNGEPATDATVGSSYGGCTALTFVQSAGVLYITLDPILTALDGVLNGMLRALGIQLGYVDIPVTGVRCGLPVLVS